MKLHLGIFLALALLVLVSSVRDESRQLESEEESATDDSRSEARAEARAEAQAAVRVEARSKIAASAKSNVADKTEAEAKAQKKPVDKPQPKATVDPKLKFQPAPTHPPYIKKVLSMHAKKVKNQQSKVAASAKKVKTAEANVASATLFLDKSLAYHNVGHQKAAMDSLLRAQDALTVAKKEHRLEQDKYEVVQKEHAKLQTSAEKAPEVPQHMGCYKDKPTRALPHGHGSVGGVFMTNSFAIKQCASLAFETSDNVFGLQNGNECWSGHSSKHDYAKYGLQRDMKECGPLGGGWTNQVYSLSEE